VKYGRASWWFGNFAEDREKASEAGRKGGQHSGGNFKMIRSVRRSG
jgi:general stress protein YciG